MKVLPFKIPKTTQESFRVQRDKLPYFYDRLHHHPELQITLILKGYGTQFIGNSVRSFQEGDIFVIASNIPHVLKSDPIFYQDEKKGVAAISIFFKQESFGKEFFHLPELHHIAEWMYNLRAAIQVVGKSCHQLRKMMEEITHLTGFQRFLQLLSILDILTQSKSQQIIAHQGFDVEEKSKDRQHMNKIFQYLMDNYDKRISLEEVARLVNKSEASFCRYFKLRTQKTFVQYLNEIRIGVACKELQEQQYSISEICYQCGFSNLSNFNRRFKQIMQLSPSEYRKRRQL